MSLELLEQLRGAMRCVTAPVAVITNKNASYGDVATTVSSLISVSLEPATLLCCLSSNALAEHKLEVDSKVAVSLLSDADATIANQCAFEAQGADRFAGADWTNSSYGKVYSGSLLYFFAKVSSLTISGTHTVVILSVEKIKVSEDSEHSQELLYRNGKYGKFIATEK